MIHAGLSFSSSYLFFCSLAEKDVLLIYKILSILYRIIIAGLDIVVIGRQDAGDGIHGIKTKVRILHAFCEFISVELFITGDADFFI